jgi:hypothetical protein
VQEHSLLGYLHHSANAITVGNLSTEDAARLIGYSYSVADPVVGSLTVGAGAGLLSCLTLPCPCSDYLAQKGIFLNAEPLELQYQFVDGLFGHSGKDGIKSLEKFAL